MILSFMLVQCIENNLDHKYISIYDSQNSVACKENLYVSNYNTKLKVCFISLKLAQVFREG